MPRRHAAGFTLIEILVVVVIIGVMISAVVLSVGVAGRDRELEDETEQFTRAGEVVLEQAQLEGRDYGFRFAQEGWDMRVFDSRTGVWHIITNDRLLGSHDLPEGLEQRLEVEGRPVVLKRRAQSDETVAPPQGMAFGSGEWQPFRWTLVRPGSGGTPERFVVVEGRPDGTLKVSPPEDAKR
jgi:general secretion pathway protein H